MLGTGLAGQEKQKESFGSCERVIRETVAAKGRRGRRFTKGKDFL
jgi:hypothetical protein